VGLPVTFAEISTTELTRDDLMTVALAASGPDNFMDSMPFPVSAEMTFDALVAADARGRKFRARESA
jgi:glycerol dehydrogenase